MNADSDKRLGDIDDLDVGDTARKTRMAGAGSASASVPRAPVAPRSGLNLWMVSTVLLGILVALLGAWFYRELGTLRGQVDQTLNDSSRQLGDLASQLSATDESLNQSSGKITDTLDLHDSEIRKLWGVSNDRNKKWIQDLQAAVATLEKQRGQLSKSVDGLRGDLKSLQASVKQTETARTQLQTRIDLLTDTVRQLEGKLSAQQKVTDALAKLKPQLDAVARLQSQGEGLDVRLAELEAAINAVDAYRREVNVRLDKLEGR